MRIEPIEGWEGYFVREDGVIFSDRCKRLRGVKQKERVVVDPTRRHPIRTSINPKSGYEYVNLTVNQKRRTTVVHALVLETYAGPRLPGQEARHIDGNKLNNAFSNLTWGTHVENEKDKDLHGTRMHGDTHANSKLTVDKVRDIRRRIGAGEQMKTIANDMGVHLATISDVHRGLTWRHVK